ncbi:uncharacterized protein LOC128209183 [Mya arenaria]|uniref:uncharacterized protein LOC128209183 n=1 Tax=Mya arenaria TaxID=6604 RepID=UPI0022E2FB5B|nr:uncharacterized protein LOC128209183 [Mya arenaria]
MEDVFGGRTYTRGGRNRKPLLPIENKNAVLTGKQDTGKKNVPNKKLQPKRKPKITAATKQKRQKAEIVQQQEVKEKDDSLLNDTLFGEDIVPRKMGARGRPAGKASESTSKQAKKVSVAVHEDQSEEYVAALTVENLSKRKKETASESRDDKVGNWLKTAQCSQHTAGSIDLNSQEINMEEPTLPINDDKSRAVAGEATIVEDKGHNTSNVEDSRGNNSSIEVRRGAEVISADERRAKLFPSQFDSNMATVLSNIGHLPSAKSEKYLQGKKGAFLNQLRGMHSLKDYSRSRRESFGKDKTDTVETGNDVYTSGTSYTKYTTGSQLTGLTTATGSQLTGMTTATGFTTGSQLTGMSTATGFTTGSQLTGMSTATGFTSGSQITGMSTATGFTTGSQITGMSTATGFTSGSQITGMSTATGFTTGSQITGQTTDQLSTVVSGSRLVSAASTDVSIEKDVSKTSCLKKLSAPKAKTYFSSTLRKSTSPNEMFPSDLSEIVGSGSKIKQLEQEKTPKRPNEFIMPRSPVKVLSRPCRQGNLDQKNSTQLFTTGFVEIADIIPTISAIEGASGERDVETPYQKSYNATAEVVDKIQDVANEKPVHTSTPNKGATSRDKQDYFNQFDLSSVKLDYEEDDLLHFNTSGHSVNSEEIVPLSRTYIDEQEAFDEVQFDKITLLAEKLTNLSTKSKGNSKQAHISTNEILGIPISSQSVNITTKVNPKLTQKQRKPERKVSTRAVAIVKPQAKKTKHQLQREYAHYIRPKSIGVQRKRGKGRRSSSSRSAMTFNAELKKRPSSNIPDLKDLFVTRKHSKKPVTVKNGPIKDLHNLFMARSDGGQRFVTNGGYELVNADVPICPLMSLPFTCWEVPVKMIQCRDHERSYEVLCSVPPIDNLVL